MLAKQRLKMKKFNEKVPMPCEDTAKGIVSVGWPAGAKKAMQGLMELPFHF